MIRELEKQDFGTIASHFGARIQFPEARAVIEGNNPGWVFVDDSSLPTTALVWAQGIQGFYLGGDHTNSAFLNELDGLVDRVIAPRLVEMGLDWFEVSGGKDWDAVIERVFAKRGLEKGLQLVYTLDPYKHKPEPATETDFEIREVNGDLIRDVKLRNREFLLSKIASFWTDTDAFLELGLGYALVGKNEIVSACISGFVSRAIQAIDIETLEEHRRKGYAEAVGREFVGACTKRGLWPYWDCMAENVPSRRLAEKLGFINRAEYALYSFRLPGREA